MKIKLFTLALLSACISCKKGDKKETYSPIAVSDSAAIIPDEQAMTDSTAVIPEISEQHLQIEKYSNMKTLDNTKSFVLENFKEVSLPLPSMFKNSDFLDKSVGIGDDIDLIIGKIVKLKSKTENSSTFESQHINVRKANLNLKLRVDPDPIAYEQNFDHKYSAALNFVFGDISTDKKYAYSFQLLKVSNVIISNEDLDTEKLKDVISKFSKEELKALYVIMSSTNWYLRANQYEESNLKGNFSYAINVNGERYAKTATKSSDYKIGITVAPISNFIKIPN